MIVSTPVAKGASPELTPPPSVEKKEAIASHLPFLHQPIRLQKHEKPFIEGYDPKKSLPEHIEFTLYNLITAITDLSRTQTLDLEISILETELETEGKPKSYLCQILFPKGRGEDSLLFAQFVICNALTQFATRVGPEALVKLEDYDIYNFYLGNKPTAPKGKYIEMTLSQKSLPLKFHLFTSDNDRQYYGKGLDPTTQVYRFDHGVPPNVDQISPGLICSIRELELEEDDSELVKTVKTCIYHPEAIKIFCSCLNELLKNCDAKVDKPIKGAKTVSKGASGARGLKDRIKGVLLKYFVALSSSDYNSTELKKLIKARQPFKNDWFGEACYQAMTLDKKPSQYLKEGLEKIYETLTNSKQRINPDETVKALFTSKLISSLLRYLSESPEIDLELIKGLVSQTSEKQLCTSKELEEVVKQLNLKSLAEFSKFKPGQDLAPEERAKIEFIIETLIELASRSIKEAKDKIPKILDLIDLLGSDRKHAMWNKLLTAISHNVPLVKQTVNDLYRRMDTQGISEALSSAEFLQKPEYSAQIDFIPGESITNLLVNKWKQSPGTFEQYRQLFSMVQNDPAVATILYQSTVDTSLLTDSSSDFLEYFTKAELEPRLRSSFRETFELHFLQYSTFDFVAFDNLWQTIKHSELFSFSFKRQFFQLWLKKLAECEPKPAINHNELIEITTRFLPTEGNKPNEQEIARDLCANLAKLIKPHHKGSLTLDTITLLNKLIQQLELISAYSAFHPSLLTVIFNLLSTYVPEKSGHQLSSNTTKKIAGILQMIPYLMAWSIRCGDQVAPTGLFNLALALNTALLKEAKTIPQDFLRLREIFHDTLFLVDRPLHDASSIAVDDKLPPCETHKYWTGKLLFEIIVAICQLPDRIDDPQFFAQINPLIEWYLEKMGEDRVLHHSPEGRIKYDAYERLTHPLFEENIKALTRYASRQLKYPAKESSMACAAIRLLDACYDTLTVPSNIRQFVFDEIEHLYGDLCQTKDAKIILTSEATALLSIIFTAYSSKLDTLEGRHAYAECMTNYINILDSHNNSDLTLLHETLIRHRHTGTVLQSPGFYHPYLVGNYFLVTMDFSNPPFKIPSRQVVEWAVNLLESAKNKQIEKISTYILLYRLYRTLNLFWDSITIEDLNRISLVITSKDFQNYFSRQAEEEILAASINFIECFTDAATNAIKASVDKPHTREIDYFIYRLIEVSREWMDLLKKLKMRICKDKHICMFYRLSCAMDEARKYVTNPEYSKLLAEKVTQHETESYFNQELHKCMGKGMAVMKKVGPGFEDNESTLYACDQLFNRFMLTGIMNIRLFIKSCEQPEDRKTFLPTLRKHLDTFSGLFIANFEAQPQLYCNIFLPFLSGKDETSGAKDVNFTYPHEVHSTIKEIRKEIRNQIRRTTTKDVEQKWIDMVHAWLRQEEKHRE